MDIIRLQVGATNEGTGPARKEGGYPAEAIRHGDNFYYRAQGVTLPITAHEFRMVTSNPYLYYFSTALRLHLRIHQEG